MSTSSASRVRQLRHDRDGAQRIHRRVALLLAPSPRSPPCRIPPQFCPSTTRPRGAVSSGLGLGRSALLDVECPTFSDASKGVGAARPSEPSRHPSLRYAWAGVSSATSTRAARRCTSRAVEHAGLLVLRARRTACDGIAQGLGERPLGTARGQQAGQQRVAGADRRDDFEQGHRRAQEERFSGFAHEREGAVVARDHDAAGAHLDDLLEREHEILRSLEFEADELLGLELVRHDGGRARPRGRGGAARPRVRARRRRTLRRGSLAQPPVAYQSSGTSRGRLPASTTASLPPRR